MPKPAPPVPDSPTPRDHLPDWPALLTDREAAAYSGMGKTSLWKLIASEDFPRPVRIPGTVATRFRRSDVDAWIENLKD